MANYLEKRPNFKPRRTTGGLPRRPATSVDLHRPQRFRSRARQTPAVGSRRKCDRGARLTVPSSFASQLVVSRLRNINLRHTSFLKRSQDRRLAPQSCSPSASTRLSAHADQSNALDHGIDPPPIASAKHAGCLEVARNHPKREGLIGDLMRTRPRFDQRCIPHNSIRKATALRVERLPPR